MSEPKNDQVALAAGGIAALDASTCCLGPPALVVFWFATALLVGLLAMPCFATHAY